MKACFKCGCAKPLSEFYKHKRMADGHLNKCKECTKADVAKHREENLDAIHAYDRNRANLPHRSAMRARIVKDWAAANPDKRKAQTALSNAIRDGRLFKWPACAMPDCDKAPEAHHPDYSTPLDVVWLCPSHHKRAHALTRLLRLNALTPTSE